MKNISNITSIAVSSFFILLFVYASASKLIDFEMFQVQLAQSPMFGKYSNLVSYLIIASELVVVLMLLLKRFRLTGFYASLILMTAFTAYIYVIINYSDSIPCSCGGVLENLDWDQHLIFNFTCVILLAFAIVSESVQNLKKAISLVCTFTFLTTLALLIVFYPLTKNNQGNFKRQIINPLLSNSHTLYFPADNYYFAGNQGDTLFLGHRKTPLLLSTIKPSFNSIKVDTIKLDKYNYPFRNVSINVLYPYFSVSDGKVPVIFEGRFPSLNAYDTGINRLYFSRLFALEPKQYVFKTMLLKTKKSELGILNTSFKKYLIVPDILKTKADGVFDVDGNLTIDRNNRQINYTLLYQNKTITADFDLKNIQINNTLLDISSNDAITTKTLKTGQTKLLKAPLEINLAQTIFNNKFYNVSKVRGKDESFMEFRKKDVIDVYDSQTKKYLYSFYIKNKTGVKIKGILSTKHYLYVLSGNQISRYTFK